MLGLITLLPGMPAPKFQIPCLNRQPVEAIDSAGEREFGGVLAVVF